MNRTIPKVSGYNPVEINSCKNFPWYTAREGHQTEHLIYKSYLLTILLFILFLLHVLKHTCQAYLVIAYLYSHDVFGIRLL